MRTYSIIQAPSLLITLINMFLEIASAPKVPHPEDPTNSENEYSVFGPSQATATVQVGILAWWACTWWMLHVCHVYNNRARGWDSEKGQQFIKLDACIILVAKYILRVITPDKISYRLYLSSPSSATFMWSLWLLLSFVFRGCSASNLSISSTNTRGSWRDRYLLQLNINFTRCHLSWHNIEWLSAIWVYCPSG